jgi:hypothetical protein
MGAFLRARHAKTGLSAPIPAGFPLQSLARKKGFIQNRRIAARNGAQEINAVTLSINLQVLQNAPHFAVF